MEKKLSSNVEATNASWGEEALQALSPSSPTAQEPFECETTRGRSAHDSGVASPNANADSALDRPETVGVNNGYGDDHSSPSVGFQSKTNGSVKEGKDRDQPADFGLGSSVCGEELESRHMKEDKGHKSGMGSDSGRSSEADDGIKMAYHFHIPNGLCARLIGSNGSHVKYLRAETRCRVELRDGSKGGGRHNRGKSRQHQDPNEVQLCIVEGTKNGIDRCLDLIRERFSSDQFHNLTLEQVNRPVAAATAAVAPTAEDAAGFVLSPDGTSLFQGPWPTTDAAFQPLQLSLQEGMLHHVYLSALVSAGHIFLQQPTHPTFSSLGRLELCMFNVYSRLSAPDVSKDLLQCGLICVAAFPDQYYRAQVVSYDPAADTCNVKLLDYGGFFAIPSSDLKQIRSDFLTLPFQALECYLGNVVPADGESWSPEASIVLEELAGNQIIAGRMLGVSQDGVPVVNLYGWEHGGAGYQGNEQPRLLNRELVNRGVAAWTDYC